MSCSFTCDRRHTYSYRLPLLLAGKNEVTTSICTNRISIIHSLAGLEGHHLENRENDDHLPDVAHIARLVPIHEDALLIPNPIKRVFMDLGKVLSGIIKHVLVAFLVSSQLSNARIALSLLFVLFHGYQIVSSLVKRSFFRIKDENTASLVLF